MTTCSIEGCERPAIARQLCTTHYARLRRNGTTSTVYRTHEWRPCKIEGCERRAKARDLCTMHYRRWQRGSSKVDVPGPVIGGPLIERARRLMAPGPGECQVWTGQVQEGNYPLLVTEATTYSARRLIWVDAHDGQEPPANQWVRTTCDTPRCVAPAHLVLVAAGRTNKPA